MRYRRRQNGFRSPMFICQALLVAVMFAGVAWLLWGGYSDGRTGRPRDEDEVADIGGNNTVTVAPEMEWAFAQLHIPSDHLNTQRHSMTITESIRRLKNGVPDVEGGGLNISLAAWEHSHRSCRLVRFHHKYRHKEEAHDDDIEVQYIHVPSMDRSPKAPLLLLFHGCSHTCKDFCERSVQCPACRGLAEELKYVNTALTIGFQVMAVSSQNKASKCWASSRIVKTKDSKLMWNNRDVFGVLAALKDIHVLGEAVAIVAMGASSGGTVLQVLPQVLWPQLYAVIPQISSPSFPRSPLRPRVILYDVMARDQGTLHRALEEQKKLTAFNKELKESTPVMSGNDAVGVRTGIKVLHPTPLTGDGVFSARIPFFPLKVSKALVAELALESRLVDRKSSLITVDPRVSRKIWVPIVQKVLEQARQDKASEGLHRYAKSVLYNDTLVSDESVLSEALNVLYGQHEFFADHSKDLLRVVVKYA